MQKITIEDLEKIAQGPHRVELKSINGNISVKVESDMLQMTLFFLCLMQSNKELCLSMKAAVKAFDQNQIELPTTKI